ncbi:hypothetical protein [Nocardia sp. NBC_01009]|uniref:hypothetical protein n=1 Tax=Nocardia sp. NBC_01009 TaxID=2975996 RepID=UPI00386B9732|nr:hypothetical protein OHA42_32680 [Nocardia sp. NBC_01009]
MIVDLDNTLDNASWNRWRGVADLFHYKVQFLLSRLADQISLLHQLGQVLARLVEKLEFPLQFPRDSGVGLEMGRFDILYLRHDRHRRGRRFGVLAHTVVPAEEFSVHIFVYLLSVCSELILLRIYSISYTSLYHTQIRDEHSIHLHRTTPYAGARRSSGFFRGAFGIGPTPPSFVDFEEEESSHVTGKTLGHTFAGAAGGEPSNIEWLYKLLATAVPTLDVKAPKPKRGIEFVAMKFSACRVVASPPARAAMLAPASPTL